MDKQQHSGQTAPCSQRRRRSRPEAARACSSEGAAAARPDDSFSPSAAVRLATAFGTPRSPRSPTSYYCSAGGVARSHDCRRGKGIASPDQPREPKQSWRHPGTNRPGCARSRQGTEFAESRFRASRVTFARRQRPYRRSPRSRSSGCCSARAKRSSHRCREKRCSVSSRAAQIFALI